MVEKDTSVIPSGGYCYTIAGPMVDGKMPINLCPYWSKHPEHGPQNDGHCAFLELGDWMDDGFSLLWDQVKECGINDDWDEHVRIEASYP